jgi:hypothetical protein
MCVHLHLYKIQFEFELPGGEFRRLDELNEGVNRGALPGSPQFHLNRKLTCVTSEIQNGFSAQIVGHLPLREFPSHLNIIARLFPTTDPHAVLGIGSVGTTIRGPAFVVLSLLMFSLGNLLRGKVSNRQRLEFSFAVQVNDNKRGIRAT